MCSVEPPRGEGEQRQRRQGGREAPAVQEHEGPGEAGDERHGRDRAVALMHEAVDLEERRRAVLDDDPRDEGGRGEREVAPRKRQRRRDGGRNERDATTA